MPTGPYSVIPSPDFTFISILEMPVLAQWRAFQKPLFLTERVSKTALIFSFSHKLWLNYLRTFYHFAATF